MKTDPHAGGTTTRWYFLRLATPGARSRRRADSVTPNFAVIPLNSVLNFSLSLSLKLQFQNFSPWTVSCGIGLTTGEGMCWAGPHALKEQWHHRGRGKPPAPGTNPHGGGGGPCQDGWLSCGAFHGKAHVRSPDRCVLVSVGAACCRSCHACGRLGSSPLSPGPTSVS